MTTATLILSGLGTAGALNNALAPFFGTDAGAVTLGGTAIGGMASPERVNWGGGQSLAVHKFPGGKRVIDAMGRDDDDIHFSGILIGRDRDRYAAAIDAARIEGAAVMLAWRDRLYEVVIRRAAFTDDATGSRYELVCAVREDMSDADGDAPRDLLGQVMDDIAGAIELASDGLALYATGQAILGGMETMQGTAQAAGSVAVGAGAALSLLTQARAIASQSSALTVATDATLAAGVADGTTPDAAPAAFVSAQNAGAASGAAFATSALIGRAVANLSGTPGDTTAPATVPDGRAVQAKSSPQRVAVVGGNLFAIAARTMGDATQWYRLAQANGLSDPNLSGLTTLTIPPAERAPSDGIAAPAGSAVL